MTGVQTCALPISSLAHQADTELRRPDELTPLAVEGLGLELVTRLARTPVDGGVPAWLGQARDVLHERFAEALRLADVASAVGVEPDRLARGFRRVYHEPVASYVRRLRVNAAADLLVAGPDPSIAAIAAEVTKGARMRSSVATGLSSVAPLAQGSMMPASSTRS